MKIIKTFSINVFVLAVMLALLDSARAYEMPQHTAITATAFERSVLTTQQSETYARLGFNRLNALNPFETPSPTGCIADALPTKNSYAHPRPVGWTRLTPPLTQQM